jgi:antitoxin component of MazEF toxin-antitoxin module
MKVVYYRKLQGLGRKQKTKAVYIPDGIIKELGIDTGKELEIYLEGRKIIIEERVNGEEKD